MEPPAPELLAPTCTCTAAAVEASLVPACRTSVPAAPDSEAPVARTRSPLELPAPCADAVRISTDPLVPLSLAPLASASDPPTPAFAAKPPESDTVPPAPLPSIEALKPPVTVTSPPATSVPVAVPDESVS